MSKQSTNGSKNWLSSGAQYVLVVALAIGIGLVYFPSSARAKGADFDLSSFPQELDGRVGIDITLSHAMLQTLGATDYLLREYRVGDQSLSVYITYFNTGNGALTHNPEKCYTATGWTFLNKSKVQVPGTEHLVLQSEIARGENKQVVVYWYQVRNEIITSKWKHIGIVLSRVLMGQETHSLVASISKNIGSSREAELSNDDMDFVRQAMEALANQIPDSKNGRHL